MAVRITFRSEDEEDVARVWRSGHIAPGSMRTYLQWVRRFRGYCRAHHLDERSQLTLQGAIRFTDRYIGPRKKGRVAAMSRAAGWRALHAWSSALRVLDVPLPPWRPKPVKPRLTPLLAAYRQYRLSHGGVADQTVQHDLYVAEEFLGTLRRRSRALSQITVADVDAFVAQQVRRLAIRSVLDRCSALRSFLRFLRVTNRTRHDLAAWVIAPRFQVGERPPRALPWTEVRRILRAIPQALPPGKRDFAMLLLMASYGLGAAEVLSLSLESVDWTAQIVRVRRPKTGAVIELPLLPPIAHAVAKYIRDERPSVTSARCIFVSTRLPYDPLTSAAVRHRIQHYAHRAGLHRVAIGAHAFRHSHATRQIDAGANPKVVGDILGHRRPSSTSVYVRVALRRLRAVTLPIPR